jgi:2-oxoglutarate ferredoxin oxidoreductase subunit alpha
VVGWGSTFGPIHQAVRRMRARGHDVAHVHIRHIWPLPANLGDLLHGFGRVIVPEMNAGQLKTVLRDQYLVDARSLTKVSGQPFRIAEIEAAIIEALDGLAPGNLRPDSTQLPEGDSGHDDGSIVREGLVR